MLQTFNFWKKSREEAKQYLKDHFDIDCECKLCSLPPDQDPRNSTSFKKLEDFNTWVFILMMTKQYDEARRLFEVIVEMAEKFVGQADHAMVSFLHNLLCAIIEDEIYCRKLLKNPDEVSYLKSLINRYLQSASLAYGEEHPLFKKVVSEIYSIWKKYEIIH